ncbi:divalent-cation tolerance protein CutA [Nanoarchaeota archaeon]
MPFILIYTTNKDLEESQKIANALLEKKLIACANFFPIKSAYWWQGKINNDDEYVSILKTKPDNWESVKKEIKQLHSYDCPCIIKMDVEANSEYEDWVKKEVK